MNCKTVLLLSAAVLLGLASCKDKTEEETTYLTFNGSPEFSIPPFVKAGQSFTLTPKAVTRSSSDTETSLPGCYWTVSQLSIRDTVRREGDPTPLDCTFTLEIPDTLETITVLCAMYATGYSNASYSTNAIIVRPEGDYPSLQGIQYPQGRFTDARDGRTYAYATVGDLDWMAQNLAYDGAGYSYFDCTVMDDIFGRFYDWNEASEACPDGWRLPTNEEFHALNNAFLPAPDDLQPRDDFPQGAGNHMANAYFNGTRLWEYWPDVTPTNVSGLGVLPLGYISVRGEETAHMEVLQYALFWTADEYDADRAYYRSIYMKYDAIRCETGYKDYMALSTRCVRDAAD